MKKIQTLIIILISHFMFLPSNLFAQKFNYWKTETGKAISGPMKGEQLEPLIFGDYFAFAWLVFWPETIHYE